MKLKNAQFRQGDVSLEAVESLPADVTELKRDAGGALTVMLGEATGHHHHFRESHVQLFVTPRKERFLRVVKTSLLRHEEHDPIKVPPGVYRLPTQTEWTDADEPRVVED